MRRNSCALEIPMRAIQIIVAAQYQKELCTTVAATDDGANLEGFMSRCSCATTKHLFAAMLLVTSRKRQPFECASTIFLDGAVAKEDGGQFWHRAKRRSYGFRTSTIFWVINEECKALLKKQQPSLASHQEKVVRL